ncbi:17849_t:CDS:2 [Rhizophagus irregularis]|nr:17849_t:CDS:2 [Rhizophagus irregularis]
MSIVKSELSNNKKKDDLTLLLEPIKQKIQHEEELRLCVQIIYQRIGISSTKYGQQE